MADSISDREVLIGHFKPEMPLRDGDYDVGTLRIVFLLIGVIAGIVILVTLKFSPL
jgi:hypothetical protein